MVAKLSHKQTFRLQRTLLLSLQKPITSNLARQLVDKTSLGLQHKNESRPNKFLNLIELQNLRWKNLFLLSSRKPNKIKTIALLDKPTRREVNIKATWTGFEIPDEFVVGYGIDYAQRNRNLPYIGCVKFTPTP